jgi:CelD/BcsL family acetyltransferase involved in cellulose biosynthesis
MIQEQASVPVFEVAIENRFDFTSAEYAALFEASAATAFQHPRWLTGLYGGLLQHNNAEPLIIVVRRASDKSLVMVLPLVRRHYGMLKAVEFADLRVSDYAAPVVDRRMFIAVVGQGSVQRRIRRLLKPYDVLRIGKLADDALRMNRLFGIPEPRRMDTNSYAVPLMASFEEWRAQYLNGSYAKELSKKLRQLERKGQVVFERATDPDALRETFEAMRVFRRDRFEVNGGGELLQVPAYFDFYLGIAADPSFARAYRMTLNGTTIAAAMGLSHKGGLLVILGGFTQTEHKNQSIGSLMFEQIVKHSIAHGDTLLDFTIGDEPYKLTFGATPSPMWQMARAGSVLGFAASTMLERLPSAKALARSVFHHRGGSAPKGGPRGGPPAVVPDEAEIARDTPARA